MGHGMTNKYDGISSLLLQGIKVFVDFDSRLLDDGHALVSVFIVVYVSCGKKKGKAAL